MPGRDADEEFEFLVNLLASDGVEADSAATTSGGPSKARWENGPGGRIGFIQRGSDGKFDFGQVRAFYERKKDTGKGPADSNGGNESSGSCSRQTYFPTLLRTFPTRVAERSRGGGFSGWSSGSGARALTCILNLQGTMGETIRVW